MEQRWSKDVKLIVSIDDCQVHRVSTDLLAHPHVVDRNCLLRGGASTVRRCCPSSGPSRI